MDGLILVSVGVPAWCAGAGCEDIGGPSIGANDPSAPAEARNLSLAARIDVVGSS